jgi:hypothetical protein
MQNNKPVVSFMISLYFFIASAKAAQARDKPLARGFTSHDEGKKAYETG